MLAKEDKSYKKALQNQDATDKLKYEHEKKLANIDQNYNNELVKKYVKASENANFEKAMKRQEEVNNGKAQVKKALAIAGGVALTAAVAYGVYKAYNGGPLSANFNQQKSMDEALKFAGFKKDQVGDMVSGLAAKGDTKYAKALNFTNSAAADAYHKAANFSNKHWASMSMGDKHGIKAYTGNNYTAMNKLLRFGEGGDSSTRMMIDQCTSALEKSRIREDCMVHRGIGSALPKMLGISPQELSSNPSAIIGKTFTDKGFVSTGVGQNDAWGGVKMHVFVPKGSKGMYVDPVSTYKGEHELLLQRNSSFVVKSLTKDKYGNVTDILVELIDQTLPS